MADLTDTGRIQCGWTRTNVTNELEPVVIMHWHYRHNGEKFPVMDIKFENVHPSYKGDPESGIKIGVHEVSCSDHDKIIFENAEELAVDTFTNPDGVKCLMVTLKQPSAKLPKEE